MRPHHAAVATRFIPPHTPSMKKPLLALATLLLILFLIGPLVYPIPPIADARTPEELAGSDSEFREINGLKVHLKRAGSGKPALILLHGFASSTYTWDKVMAPLATYGAVIAYDRPAFGLTERPMPGEWTGANPYSPQAQVDLLAALMDEFGIEQAILAGNSAGGAVAMAMTLQHPQRVQALILIDPFIYGSGGAPAPLKILLATPQARRLGPYLVRNLLGANRDLLASAWHDPSQVTDEVFAAYSRPTHIANWDRGPVGIHPGQPRPQARPATRSGDRPHPGDHGRRRPLCAHGAEHPPGRGTAQRPTCCHPGLRPRAAGGVSGAHLAGHGGVPASNDLGQGHTGSAVAWSGRLIGWLRVTFRYRVTLYVKTPAQAGNSPLPPA